MRLPITAALLFLSASVADAAPVPAPDVKKLIDQLVEVDRQDTGYSGASSGSAFLPFNQRNTGGMLLSPAAPEGGSDVLRRLVELGPKAVPLLLEHLSDTRPTKLKMKFPAGFNIFMSTDDEKEPKPNFFKGFEYTLMVGDLCYVALGQIVNRDYAAVRYIPSGNVGITSAPKTKKLREQLLKEWGGLTIEKFRDGLVRDLLDSDDYRVREASSYRLAYYYPEAFEQAMLKFIAKPTYDSSATEELIREKLYTAKTDQQRKDLAWEFIRANGPLASEGLKCQLFQDLDTQEANEEGRLTPKRDDPPKARESLIAVFGLPATVKSKDRPKRWPLSAEGQSRLIDKSLYDRSEKLDRAVRDLLAKTPNYFVGMQCMNRLLGRGYDADIEAYLKREIPKLAKRERTYLEEYYPLLGRTRLHIAVKLGVHELVRAAIADKVDANAKSRDGQTALLLAVEKGDPAIIELLLEAKADPNLKDTKGRLPVEIAADEMYAATVRKLVAGNSIVPNVLVAAMGDKADRIAELAKADPGCLKKRNGEGFTALHVAAWQGNAAALRQLLTLGAAADAVDEQPAEGKEKPYSRGITPLLLAVATGKAETAKLLLAAKANPNAAPSGGTTPLHAAAENGDTELVKLLLAHKADPSRKDSNDRTPLDLATDQKHEAVIQLLK